MKVRTYGSSHDFATAMKAAAWEAQNLLREEEGNGTALEQMDVAAFSAADTLNLIESPPESGADWKKVVEAIKVLAFEKPDRSEVNYQLGEGWREYSRSNLAVAA